MKKLAAIVLVLSCIHAKSQQVMEFVLADQALEGKVISKAAVFTDQKNTISRRSGYVKISVFKDECVQIKHVSYRDTSICHQQILAADTIWLSRKINHLQSVDISAKPYVLFKDEESHVMDFEFIDDSLLILTYEKEKMFRRSTEQSKSLYQGCKLLLVSPNSKVLEEHAMIDLVEGFYKDVLGQIFVITENTVFHVQVNRERLHLEPVNRQFFDERINPVKAAIDSNFVMDNYVWHYPEFSFFIQSPDSEKPEIMRTIRDNFTMELFRAEYKYMNNRDKLWAIRKEMETGVDKEVLAAYRTGFQSSLYYQSLYAPVFEWRNSYLVFDHHNGFIYRHDSVGISIDSVSIEYLNIRHQKFTDEIIADKSQDEFYAVFKKSGIKYLGNLNIDSGKAEDISRLYYPYPENIKIRDGSAYYLYRKPEDAQYTYLYSESIK